MEAVGSRLGRASSRYGGPAVFSGPVRKWKKKWVHVSSSHNHHSHSHSHSHSTNPHNNNNNNNDNHNNNNVSSRLLLRRWTPITAPTAAADGSLNSSGTVSDEPPRRKFRYTPIAVLEEQKKAVIEKAEYEPTTESDQLTARQTNVTHEMHGKLNMNEISEETKDSNICQLDLDLGFQGNNGENSQHGDDQLGKKISGGWSMN